MASKEATVFAQSSTAEKVRDSFTSSIRFGEIIRMNRVGIDCLSVFGLPPVECVNLAADLGCNYISAGLGPVGPNLSKSPSWTLRDTRLRREMIGAMKDRNVSIALGEGFVIFPGTDVSEYGSDLNTMAELGAQRIATLSIDPDMQRSLDKIAALVEQAAKVGLETVIEFVPVFTISTLSEAVSAVHHVGGGKLQILVDCMHLFRSGGTACDLRALDSEMIGYVQLCDVPRVPVMAIIWKRPCASAWSLVRASCHYLRSLRLYRARWCLAWKYQCDPGLKPARTPGLDYHFVSQQLGICFLS